MNRHPRRLLGEIVDKGCSTVLAFIAVIFAVADDDWAAAAPHHCSTGRSRPVRLSVVSLMTQVALLGETLELAACRHLFRSCLR